MPRVTPASRDADKPRRHMAAHMGPWGDPHAAKHGCMHGQGLLRITCTACKSVGVIELSRGWVDRYVLNSQQLPWVGYS